MAHTPSAWPATRVSVAGTRSVGHDSGMFKLIGRIVGLLIAVPVAFVALLLYPVVWLVLLPLRLLGGAVHGALGALRGMMGMPGRVLSGGKSKGTDND
jgi:hypothetical protein